MAVAETLSRIEGIATDVEEFNLVLDENDDVASSTPHRLRIWSDPPDTTGVEIARMEYSGTTASFQSFATTRDLGASAQRWTNVYASTVDAVTGTFSGDISGVNSVFTGYYRGGSSTSAEAAGDASFGSSSSRLFWDESSGVADIDSTISAYYRLDRATASRDAASWYRTAGTDYWLAGLSITLGGTDNDYKIGNFASSTWTNYFTIEHSTGFTTIDAALGVGAHGFTLASFDFAVGSASTNRVSWDNSAGNFQVDFATAGTKLLGIFEHTDNTNVASDTQLRVRTGGASGGDPAVLFTVIGATDWSMGIDNSDSDKFKITNAFGLASASAIEIDTNESVVINQELNVGTTALAVAQGDWATGLTDDSQASYDQSTGMFDVRNTSGNQVIFLDGANAAIGLNVTPGTTQGMRILKDWTHTSGTRYGVRIESDASPASNSTGTLYGLWTQNQHKTGFNLTNLIGARWNTETTAGFSGGTLANLVGFDAQIVHAGAGAVTNAYGFRLRTPSITGAGTISSFEQIHLEDIGSAGTVTARIAIRQRGTNGHNRFQGRTTIGADTTPTTGFELDIQGAMNLTQPVEISGSPTAVLITGGAHTSLSNAEASGVCLDLSATVQFDGGAATSFSPQRAVCILAPTYSAAVATLTIAEAATLAVSAAPSAGTNVLITSPYAFWVQSGVAKFDGGIDLGSGITDTQVIFSASGVLTGDAGLTYNSTSDILSLDGADGTYGFGIGTATPRATEVLSVFTIDDTAATALATAIIQRGTGQVGTIVSRTGGTAARWYTYIPASSTDLRLFNTADVFGFSASGTLEITGTPIIKPASGDTLAIQRQDGTAWATLDSGTGATVIGIQTNLGATLRALDNIQTQWGTGADARATWDITETNDALKIATGVNSAAQSGNIIIGESAIVGANLAYVVSADPRLYIASATTPASNFVSFHHDSQQAVIASGTNDTTNNEDKFIIQAPKPGADVLAEIALRRGSSFQNGEIILRTLQADTLVDALTIDENGVLTVTDNTKTMTYSSVAGSLSLTGTTNNFFEAVNVTAGETVRLFAAGGQGFVGTSSDHLFTIRSNNTDRWRIERAGHFTPFITNTYDIGTASLAVQRIFTNAIRPGTATSLLIEDSVGTAWGTLSAGSMVVNTLTTHLALLGLNDDFDLFFGTSGDSRIDWSTAQTNDGIVWSTPVGSAAGSGNYVLTADANKDVDHAYAAASDPRLYIASTTTPGTNHMSFHTDSSGNATWRSGANLWQIEHTGGSTRVGVNANVSGVTLFTLTQGVNTSGTPKLAVFTGGSHTGMSNADLIEVDIALGRTISFTGGAATVDDYQGVRIINPTLTAASSGLTVTNATTLYISGAPADGGGNIVLTNAYALWIDGGAVQIDDWINIGSIILAVSAGDFAAGSTNDFLFFDASAPELNIAASSTNNAVLVINAIGTGDPRIKWEIASGATNVWNMGTDNDVSDNFVFGGGATPTTNPVWTSTNANKDMAIHKWLNVGATTIADAANELGVGESGTYFLVSPSDDTLLWRSDNGGATGAIFSLTQEGGSQLAADIVGQIQFNGQDDADAANKYGQISGYVVSSGAGSEDGGIRIECADTGAMTTLAEFEVSAAGTPQMSFFGVSTSAKLSHIADASVTGGSATGAAPAGGDSMDASRVADKIDVDAAISQINSDVTNLKTALDAALVVFESFGLTDTV